MLAQRSVKRVARLINCDQSWYDASFAGVPSGASSLLTVALVGCIRRLEKCCWVTLVGLRVSCSHRWYDTDACQSPSRCVLVMSTHPSFVVVVVIVVVVVAAAATTTTATAAVGGSSLVLRLMRLIRRTEKPC
jgi:hypothetical protein